MGMALLVAIVLSVFLGSVPTHQWDRMSEDKRTDTVLMMADEFNRRVTGCRTVYIRAEKNDYTLDFYGTCLEWGV